MKKLLVVAVLAALLVFVAAPAWGDVAAQEEPTTTEAPATTQAPDTGDQEDEDVPWWLLLLIVGAIVILIAAIARGGKRKTVHVAAPDPGWKPNARKGYADARWLYDTMNEDIAIWRGNAQFDGTTAPGSTADTAKADTWQALAGRMDGARDALYGLEAAAPDAQTAQLARAVVSRLNTARETLDARADARHNYRTVAAGSADDPDRGRTLAEARDREVRTGQNLVTARRELADALTHLSALT